MLYLNSLITLPKRKFIKLSQFRGLSFTKILLNDYNKILKLTFTKYNCYFLSKIFLTKKLKFYFYNNNV